MLKKQNIKEEYWNWKRGSSSGTSFFVESGKELHNEGHLRKRNMQITSLNYVEQPHETQRQKTTQIKTDNFTLVHYMINEFR